MKDAAPMQPTEPIEIAQWAQGLSPAAGGGEDRLVSARGELRGRWTLLEDLFDPRQLLSADEQATLFGGLCTSVARRYQLRHGQAPGKATDLEELDRLRLTARSTPRVLWTLTETHPRLMLVAALLDLVDAIEGGRLPTDARRVPGADNPEAWVRFLARPTIPRRGQIRFIVRSPDAALGEQLRRLVGARLDARLSRWRGILERYDVFVYRSLTRVELLAGPGAPSPPASVMDACRRGIDLAQAEHLALAHLGEGARSLPLAALPPLRGTVLVDPFCFATGEFAAQSVVFQADGHAPARVFARDDGAWVEPTAFPAGCRVSWTMMADDGFGEEPVARGFFFAPTDAQRHIAIRAHQETLPDAIASLLDAGLTQRALMRLWAARSDADNVDVLLVIRNLVSEAWTRCHLAVHPLDGGYLDALWSIHDAIHAEIDAALSQPNPRDRKASNAV